MDGKGAIAIRMEYADAELKGETDVYAVRERVDNGDGSFDPFGPLTGLKKYSQAEFDAREFRTVDSARAQSVEATFIAPGTAQEAVDAGEFLKRFIPFGLSYDIDRATGALNMRWQGKTVHSIYAPEEGAWITDVVLNSSLGHGEVVLEPVYENGKLAGLREREPRIGSDSATAQSVNTEELLEAYRPFGLSYRIHPVTGELSMEWQRKPVHSVYDAEKTVWIANNMFGLDLGPDAVDLEAIYENGKLTGLRETRFDYVEYTVGVTYVADGSMTIAEPGISFAERFAQYAPFGITYEEAEGASGAGNVYYNGRLVSRFADITPDGGAFTFTSAKQGGMIVKMLYDDNGNLTGVGTITA